MCPEPQHLPLCLPPRRRAELLEAGAHSGLLVTCDQVVLHEGQVLEKPEDEAEVGSFEGGYRGWAMGQRDPLRKGQVLDMPEGEAKASGQGQDRDRAGVCTLGGDRACGGWADVGACSKASGRAVLMNAALCCWGWGRHQCLLSWRPAGAAVH